MPIHVGCRADDADKHIADVSSLVFHKGKLLSAGDDGNIKVWAEDLKLLGQIRAHPCSVFCIAASDDTIYSCSNEGTVKAWNLNDLTEKKVINNDKDREFWVVRYVDGVLYVGDDTGNVHIYKGETLFGSINVAEPVKDLAINKNLLFSVKDNDVVITDLHLGGAKPQFGVKKTLQGRAPLALSGDNLVISSREGKDLHIFSTSGQIDLVSEVKGAHDMIINALATATWDGKPLLFSGGWDKKVKQWSLVGGALKAEASVNVDIAINALAVGSQGIVYAAGSDGHIVRIDF